MGIVAAAASLAACSLFTDLGGLDKSAETGAADASDAQATTDTGGGGGGDANPSDNAGASDGDASADGGRFCEKATGLVFCADFDDVATPEIGWTATYGGLALALDGTHHVSPPLALRVAAPALDAGANAQ